MGKKVSPWVSPEENEKYIEFAAKIAALGQQEINLKSEQEVETRIGTYFKLCVEYGMKPSTVGLGLAFDISSTTLLRWINGHVQRVPESAVRQLNTAYNMITLVTEALLMDSKVHPLAGMFALRAKHGFQDGSERIVPRIDALQSGQSTDALAKKYLDAGNSMIVEGTVSEPEKTERTGEHD